VWRGAGNERIAGAVAKEKKRLLTLRGAG